MRPASPFTAIAAVECWDAWFRWRDAGGLRDRTIDATWWRVARAVAAAESVHAAGWAEQYFDAFAHWRLLPDEDLLRFAGTRSRGVARGPLAATLNVAAFLRGMHPQLDLAGVSDTAALAVRLLDDARLAGCAPDRSGNAVRIGVLGLGDALRELRLDYDSAAARTVAADVAMALTQGALRGAVELARERGAAIVDDTAAAANAIPVLDAALRTDYRRWGSRFVCLTAITPQPRLARLANDASDAVDAAAGSTPATLVAQLELRAAMQPWIDAPIDYPLVARTEVPAEQLRDAARFAQAHGVAVPLLSQATTAA